MDLPNLEIACDWAKSLYQRGAACHMDRLHPYDATAYHYFHQVNLLLPKIRWHKGIIEAGRGAAETGPCLVTWVNFCPLTVLSDPQPMKKYREPGEPIFGYSFQYIVHGHMSGSSSTFAGAAQEAAMRAIYEGRDGSDSTYLKKGGKDRFFADMKADLTQGLTFADLMVPENLVVIPVTSGPYAEQPQDQNR